MATSTSKKSVTGAAKKSTAKKSQAKKAAPKKEVIKYTASDVALNSTQSKQVEMVVRNQTKIEAKMEDMLKIANDSGERLVKLRDDIQAKYGRVWKEWAQANLPISYEQASKYMKLAGASDTEFEALEATSLDQAVKQLEHMRKPEKAEAAAKKAAAKAAAPKPASGASSLGIISPATLDEIERCNDIEDLEAVIELARKRIEELKQAEATGEGDDDEILEGDDDVADDIAEHVGEDPLS